MEVGCLFELLELPLQLGTESCKAMLIVRLRKDLIHGMGILDFISRQRQWLKVEPFAEFGSDLPAMTRGLVAVSDFFEANFFYMVIGAVVIGVGGYFYVKTPGGKRRKDVVMLKIPIIGPALLKGALSRFCRNMSMLVGAGVTLFEALKLTSETTDNAVIAESVAGVRSRVGDGQLFSQAVAADSIFPALMPEMIGVGEEAGSLEGQLVKVSDFYEEEAERAIAQVTGTLTPALTLGVGLIIGLIAVTIYSSIYSMVDVLPD